LLSFRSGHSVLRGEVQTSKQDEKTEQALTKSEARFREIGTTNRRGHRKFSSRGSSRPLSACEKNHGIPVPVEMRAAHGSQQRENGRARSEITRDKSKRVERGENLRSWLNRYIENKNKREKCRRALRCQKGGEASEMEAHVI